MLFMLCAGILALTVYAEEQASDLARAREVLVASAKAYREVAALRDTLSYVVIAPGSERETKSEEYTFAPNGAVMVRNALLETVAFDSKFYLSQNDVPDRYVTASYDGDFGATLRRVAGRGSLFEPPPLALHSDKNIEACLDSLTSNFKL
jgi:hypothetical protein